MWYRRKTLPGERTEKCDAGCGVVPSALIVWKRAIPRNRMREILTSGSVGGLAEQSPILPGQPTCYPYDYSTVTENGKLFARSSRQRVARTRLNRSDALSGWLNPNRPDNSRNVAVVQRRHGSAATSRPPALLR